jgi:hypothetical protein
MVNYSIIQTLSILLRKITFFSIFIAHFFFLSSFFFFLSNNSVYIHLDVSIFIILKTFKSQGIALISSLLTALSFKLLVILLQINLRGSFYHIVKYF